VADKALLSTLKESGNVLDHMNSYPSWKWVPFAGEEKFLLVTAIYICGHSYNTKLDKNSLYGKGLPASYFSLLPNPVSFLIEMMHKELLTG